jgi:hypothetical protein
MLSRWKEHFEQHLNEVEERDQSPDQVDYGVDIEEIESVLNFDQAAEKRCTKMVLCPVYKKGDKCFRLLKVAYKVFTKVLYDRLLPFANAVGQHYHAGFQSGKSTTDQFFALRQIHEIVNEYNIQTHHLFLNFKAEYDNIIRNEAYVSV